MSKIKFLLCFFFFAIVTVGCNDLELDIRVSNDLTLDEVEFIGVVSSNDVLLRAYQMASLEWTPVKRIPYRNGVFFEPGKKVSGVPYSSVKEINTYLFQDVSYHTFMTAVHNPNSVLYTEDISQAPYHGINCAPYYGSVCSSSVMYALGFSIPYYANQIKDLPCMHKIDPQVIDSLKVCDVIWKPGHVQMVFNVENRADTLYQITTFESSGKNAHLYTYSKDEFERMWVNDNYVGYRYRFIVYSEEPTKFKSFPPIVYNEDLCPSKGDKSVYRSDDIITINIFNNAFDHIVLSKESTMIESASIKGDSYSYCGLRPGIYEVYLQNDQGRSDSVSFEIIDVNVKCRISDDRESIVISFESSSEAVFAAVCRLEGDSVYYPISDADKNRGCIVIPRRRIPKSYSYCKVIFRGKYGRIINNPLRVG